MAQARFLGSYEVQIDGKGRVMLPAKFRTSLCSAHNNQLPREIVVVPIEPLKGAPHCLEACTRDDLDLYLAQIEADDTPANSERYEVLMEKFGDCHDISLDVDGRMVLPRKLLDRVGIAQELRFVGVAGKFRLWDPAAHDRFRERLAQSTVSREVATHAAVQPS